MRYLRLAMLFTVMICIALSLGLRKADAGMCSQMGYSNGCVRANDIASNAVNSGRVRNNNLKAADLRDEPGADFADGGHSTALTSTETTIRSVTITAPRPGVVIVNASGHFTFGAAGAGCRCSITTDTAIDYGNLIIAEGDADTTYVPFAATRGYSVPQGSTTFNLVCDEYADPASIQDTSLTAIYVPTRY